MATRLPVVSVVFAVVLCLLAPVGVGAGKNVEIKETTFDSAISDVQWFGKDNKLVLVQTSKGRLYRSTDGGDKWTDITDKLAAVGLASIVVEQISKSPADSMVAAIVGTRKNHFVTKDGGATWTLLRRDTPIHTFMFHKTRPQWALVSTWTPSCDVQKYGAKAGSAKEAGSSPCNHVLYLTKDLGKTFQLINSYVVQFSWGDVAHKQEDRIYITHFRQKKGDQPRLYLWSKEVDFSYTDSGGRNVKPMVPQGNKFWVSHNFLFVAMLKDSASQTVKLKVSADGGENFSDAKLPQELEEKSYSILDTSEGAVMLHVNHGSKDTSGVGDIYISDKDGLRYSLSLPNNVRSNSGDCEFDRVLSLDGVYLANIKEEPARAASGEDPASRKAEATKEDEELEQSSAAGTEVERRRSAKAKAKQESIVRTVITFDRGGLWSYLKPPKVDSLGKKIECPPERCWLHLHGITNFRNYAPFYSTSNAVGIIMGTGNTGPYLRFEEDQTNTYMSRDGGLTWVEVHKGAYIYEYGDHGGLVVMADDIRKTKQAVFSWNEGQTWYDFDLSKFPLEVDNIVTEPNATSTRFLLYGTRSDAGVMYHLNFEALGQPPCSGLYAVDSASSDYETWTPSDGRGGTDRCILGRQVTYTRRKQTSECFNGEKFERPAVRKNCKCTEEDFECEMGFTPTSGTVGADSASRCRFADDGSVPIPSKCTSSDIFHADAYRKVVGDTCEGGWKPTPLAVPCPAGSQLSRGALSVLGTVGIIGALLAAVTFMTRSDKFKGVFANYGFESFENVKYATIGAKVPETAAYSIGANYDHGDFDQDDRDEFAGDAHMMSYNSASPNRGRDLPERRSVESASAPVPRPTRPPGSGGASAGQDLELL